VVTWLRQLLRPAPEDLIVIDRQFTQAGVQYGCFLREGQRAVRTIHFPVDQGLLPSHLMLQQKHLPALAALEGLWIDGILEEDKGGYYHIPYDSIDRLPGETTRILKIPPRQPVDIDLHANSAVGLPDFYIDPVVRDRDRGRLPLARRVGDAIVVAKDDVVLLERPVVELLDRIREHPKERQDQFEYLAEIKARAKALGAELDEYLEREEYYYPADVDVDIEISSADKIMLHPVFPDPPATLDVSQLSSRNPHITRRGPDGQRLRGILSKPVQEKLKLIEESQIIEGEQVPKFLQNPQAVLPDGLDIDLSQYSDRVKALGIRVYKARPYIRARERDNGWFDIGIDVHLEDALVDDTSETALVEKLDRDILADLAKQAPEGARWVQHGNRWIELPRNVAELTRANEELRKLAPQGQVESGRLDYILEIYANIDDLEYDSFLIDRRRTLTARGAGGLTTALPDSFRGQLYPFQTQGYAWMQGLYSIPLGGLLADEMGLGKTVQVIAFMAWLLERRHLCPSLVVAPVALVDNWENELVRFLPGVQLQKHMGLSRKRHSDQLESVDVVLTTYETLSRDELMLGRVSWQLMVCDEAQAMKNFTTGRSRVCKAMKAEMRLAVTGTPVENSLGELWSIVDYSQPGLLGSYREFRQEYELPLERAVDLEERQKVEAQLLSRIQPVYRRRTKGESAKQLPPKRIVVEPVALGPEQERLYLDAIADLKCRTGDKRGAALETIHRLLDICAHPAIEMDNWQDLSISQLLTMCPKLRKTVDILRQVRVKGEKALIFTRVRKMQDLLAKVILDQFGFRPRIINGTSKRRFDIVESFNRGSGFDVMILSPQAAGVGLTITGANHVIHYTRWWNPAVEQQATDRVHRFGQQRPVYVYIPIVTEESFPRGTVEEVLHRLLQHKEELARSVIVPSSRMKITEKDWLAALGLEPPDAETVSSSLDESTSIVLSSSQESGVMVDQEALQEILDLCDPEYAPIVQECARRRLPLPEVGVDIVANGRVVGNGELIWGEVKVVVILPNEKLCSRLEGMGWTVFDLDSAKADGGLVLWNSIRKEQLP
jgi:SNF2 family DNA or RNA helicase